MYKAIKNNKQNDTQYLDLKSNRDLAFFYVHELTILYTCNLEFKRIANEHRRSTINS